MGAKTRKRPMSNEEAVIKLESAGFVMQQFKLDNLQGYYVPLQLWSKYVGKFNPAMRRGWRVELNTESSRQVKRRYNMKEINEMTASLGIGNGNYYQFDHDEKLDVLPKNKYSFSNRPIRIDHYKQPIKVGNRFITNIIQSHRIHNEKMRDGKLRYVLTPRNQMGVDLMEETYENYGNYKQALHSWTVEKQPLNPSVFQNVVDLKPDGVLRGVKQPYGTITGVYVHFFDSWNTKREARYHVTFDHGARVVITNDWISRTWATTYPEGSTFLTCGYEFKHSTKHCKTCPHSEVHKPKYECDSICANVKQHAECLTVMDYREQNMFVVHRGEGFKVPKPVREPEQYVSPEERIKLENKLHWGLVRGHIPESQFEFDHIVESILIMTGGRI
jgi:hypothetical protein